MNNCRFLLVKYIFPILVFTPVLLFWIDSALFKKHSAVFADFNNPVKERDLDSSFSDENDSEFLSNPLQLMNVLREIESINNSTPPSDAIEDALKAFENENQQESSFDENF